jgi:hypothetical protein
MTADTADLIQIFLLAMIVCMFIMKDGDTDSSNHPIVSLIFYVVFMFAFLAIITGIALGIVGGLVWAAMKLLHLFWQSELGQQIVQEFS